MTCMWDLEHNTPYGTQYSIGRSFREEEEALEDRWQQNPESGLTYQSPNGLVCFPRPLFGTKEIFNPESQESHRPTMKKDNPKIPESRSPKIPPVEGIKKLILLSLFFPRLTLHLRRSWTWW